MTTLESIWNAIVPYLTTGTLVSIVITAILTGLKLVKYQKATRLDAIKAIEDKLMSLSVNKDVRLSLETMTRDQIKKIENVLVDRVEKVLDTYGKEVAEILNIVKTITSALAHFKAIPSEQVAELNAVLGLVSPATIIELKPIAIATPDAPQRPKGDDESNPFQS